MKKFIAIEINGNEAVVYEISDNNTYDLNLRGLLAGLTSNNYNYVEVEQFFNENTDNANSYIKSIHNFYKCNGINIYAAIANDPTDVKIAVSVATNIRSMMFEEALERKSRSKSRILTGLGLVAAVAVGAVIGYTVLSNTEIPVEL